MIRLANPGSQSRLELEAIKAATRNQWNRAIRLNRKILKLKPQNTASLNRLGKAYWENGKLRKARQAFEVALAIDPYNNIAAKNLIRLKNTKDGPRALKISASKNGAIFLKEPGKTKIVKLVRLASNQVLCGLGCAEEVFLQPGNRLLNVVSQKGTYLGCFPEDLSLRLIKFIKTGNCYQAYVSQVDSKNLCLFIREVKRSLRNRNVPSFLSLGIWVTLQTKSFSSL